MRARLADCAVMTQAMVALAEAHFPGLNTSRERVQDELRERLASAQHWCGIAGDGLLVSRCGDIPFVSRHRMAVIELLSSADLKSTTTLLSEFIEWVDQRPLVKFSIYTPLHDAAPALRLVLAKAGFNRQGGNFIRWRQ